MSAESLLKQGLSKHEYHHDLESLLYVLCFVYCVCAGPPNGAWRMVWYNKLVTVALEKNFRFCIPPTIHEYFELLDPRLEGLHRLSKPPCRKTQKAYWENKRRKGRGTDEPPKCLIYGDEAWFRLWRSQRTDDLTVSSRTRQESEGAALNP